MLRNAAAGVALATFGFASAASAATTDSADVRAEILTALSVEVDTDDDVLDFGTFADGGITGDVTLTVGTDGALVSCPTNAVCAGTPDAPTFNVIGADNLDVAVTFVNLTEPLAHPNAALFPTMDTDMTVGSFTTNHTGNVLTLDTDGLGSFFVGGTLTVSPNQAPGVYAGEVSVLVEYD